MKLKAVTLELARISDAEAIVRLLNDLSAWLKSKGIHQWSGGIPLSTVLRDIEDGHLYVYRENNHIIAAVTLNAERNECWNEIPAEGLLIHRLAVDRNLGARGLGRQILGWIEAEVKARGMRMLRLECDAGNSALRSYYENAGFQLITVKRYPEYNMDFALYQKQLF